MSGQIGEVEQKLLDLSDEVMQKYRPTAQAAGSEEILHKEQIRQFILDVVFEAGEQDAWDDTEFDECYREFDANGDGNVDKGELLNFIKRFAAL